MQSSCGSMVCSKHFFCFQDEYTAAVAGDDAGDNFDDTNSENDGKAVDSDDDSYDVHSEDDHDNDGDIESDDESDWVTMSDEDDIATEGQTPIPATPE